MDEFRLYFYCAIPANCMLNNNEMLILFHQVRCVEMKPPPLKSNSTNTTYSLKLIYYYEFYNPTHNKTYNHKNASRTWSHEVTILNIQLHRVTQQQQQPPALILTNQAHKTCWNRKSKKKNMYEQKKKLKINNQF